MLVGVEYLLASLFIFKSLDPSVTVPMFLTPIVFIAPINSFQCGHEKFFEHSLLIFGKQNKLFLCELD